MLYFGQSQLLVLSWILLLLAQSGLGSDSCSKLKNYTVSNSSCSDNCINSSLLLMRPPCCSLSYLLTKIQGISCVNITILNNQSLSGGLFQINKIHNWTITGKGPIHINCINPSGIQFFSSYYIRFDNLHFVGCSVVNSLKDNYPLIEYAGLYFYKGYDVEIVSCGFHNSNGTGLIMNDVGGENNLIMNTNFTGNKIPALMATGGGLIVRHSGFYSESLPKPAFIIKRCSFRENGNSTCYHYNDVNTTFAVGGGAIFNISVSTNITIIDSHFISNNACQGGGLHIYQRKNLSEVYVKIESSTFEHNHVLHQGGGIYAQQRVALNSTLYLHLNNTFFRNNSGDSGAGLGVYSGNSKGCIVLIVFYSNWSGNDASDGFAVSLAALPKTTQRPNEWSDFHINAFFYYCNFSLNFNKGYISATSKGAVNLRGSHASFHEVQFSKNTGTALYINYFSYASFTGNVSFVSNKGSNGGALYIDPTSLVGLKEGFITFQDNHAIMNGGAIYVEYSMDDDRECIFEKLRAILNNSSITEDVGVNFINNTAGSLEPRGQNQSIFVGSASGCLWNESSQNVTMDDIILFDQLVFSYSPREKAQVASFARTITLDYTPKGDGHYRNYIQVMPGQYFYLKPTSRDVFGNDAYQYGILMLELQGHLKNSYVELVGPHIISMESFTQNNQLSIRASKDMMYRDDYKLYLNFVTFQQYSSQDKNSDPIQVHIKLSECKVGFTYDDSKQVCVCTSNDDFACSSSSHSFACVRYGYWHDNNAQYEALPCPGNNCHYVNGRCPNNESRCPGSPDLCPFKANDSLCNEGRTGVLCSKCLSDHAFTFAASHCVDNSTCNNIIFFTLGLNAYWICLVIFLLFILSIDMSMGSGMAHGIMYYFSVVEIFTDNTVTESLLRTIISTSVAVTQLYPQAFGVIPICFVEKWRLNLHHQLFHYMTPAAVIFLILAVILWSKFCPCPKKISPAENTPIHAMCLLILASYTSVTFTSFEILKPLRIGTNDLRVYVDPHLKFFQKEHLPYAIVALFFEFFTLPICFLILFAPCLSRKVNIVKLRLKPILDEFQACYHPKCRWFAGFYFLARQVIFLVNIIPTGSLPESNTYLHIINAVILIIHFSFQPYKRKWLNVLDTLLLADILFLSFFQLEYDSNFAHRAAAYLLIVLPSLYLALIVLLAILYRLFSCCKHLVCVQRFKFHQGNKLSSTEVKPTHNSVAINASGFEDSGDDGEREPLLADSVHSGQIPYPHNRNSGRARPFTTASVRISRINCSHS